MKKISEKDYLRFKTNFYICEKYPGKRFGQSFVEEFLLSLETNTILSDLYYEKRDVDAAFFIESKFIDFFVTDLIS